MHVECEVADDAHRYAVDGRELVARRRRFFLLISLEDGRYYHKGHLPLVAHRHFSDISKEIECEYILHRVGQHAAEQQHQPGELQPYKQQGQEREGAVDGIVFGDIDLAVDKEKLQHLEGYGAEQPRYGGVFKLYLGVGYQKVGE